MTVSRRRLLPAGDLAAWPPPLDVDGLVKWAEVDTTVLRDNVAALVAHVGDGVAVMAMVKGNGYGHGAVLTAQTSVDGGASWLGVSSADEALQLRRADIRQPILVVGWTPDAALPALLGADVDVAVFSVAGVKAIAATGLRARVHLKLDTGMGRLGARAEETAAVVSSLRDHAGQIEVAGIFTHFASSESDPDFTRLQNQRLVEQVAALRADFPSALAHAANSAALIEFPETRHDLVRPGIAMYGYPPPGAGAARLGLRPALSLFARVSHVKTLRPGDSVGYGRAWTAERATNVATIAIGYADGISRQQGGRGAVVAAGVRCPIIGRVSMDQIAVDVSDVGVGVGDAVLIVGCAGDVGLGADEVADAAGTISYEILTSISARVPRFIVA